MENFPLKKETYAIIGVCMEVQRTLGFGFSEVIYKDAMEVEFISNNVLYQREEELSVTYKSKTLQHRFFADFTCYNLLVIEVKSSDKGIADDHVAQTLNYLRVSGYTIGLIINFGKRRLEYKRLISNSAEQ
ncbi:MAG TPA: GxxExxY protein [Chitinophagaceae bacterium]